MFKRKKRTIQLAAKLFSLLLFWGCYEIEETDLLNEGQCGVSYAELSASQIGLSIPRDETPMPVGLENHAMVASDSHAYILGGLRQYTDGDNIDQSARSILSDKVYAAPIGNDGVLGEWETLRPLPLPLQQHSAVVLNGYIFVFGGLSIAGIILSDEVAWPYSEKVYGAKIKMDGTLDPWQEYGTFPVGSSNLVQVYDSTIVATTEFGSVSKEVLIGSFSEYAGAFSWQQLSLPLSAQSHRAAFLDRYLVSVDDHGIIYTGSFDAMFDDWKATGKTTRTETSGVGLTYFFALCDTIVTIDSYASIIAVAPITKDLAAKKIRTEKISLPTYSVTHVVAPNGRVYFSGGSKISYTITDTSDNGSIPSVFSMGRVQTLDGR
ncbi:MAG: hypothetical protein IPJ88_02375 [Myxococcales bacterium]|nr:MAG: hypothetical protein IPJ88_02375 [Myxococcales bacterium]